MIKSGQDSIPEDDRLYNLPPEIANGPQAAFTNPLMSGLRFGIMGAMSGLGMAAIQRAVRLQAGNKLPVSVVKPMMLGTIIGTALGTGGSIYMNKRQGVQPMRPTPQTWHNLASMINEDMYGYPLYEREGATQYAGLSKLSYNKETAKMKVKHVPYNPTALRGQQPPPPAPPPVAKTAAKYAGLMRITVGKKASVLGTAADIGSYFIPGVGTARMGWDSLKGFGGGIKSLSQGDLKGFGGSLLSGLGNGGFAALSLVPGGGALKGLARMLRTGKRSGKPVGSFMQAMRSKLSPENVSSIRNLGQNMENLATRVPGAHLVKGKPGSMVNPTKMHGLVRWGAIPAMIGGGVMGSGAADESVAYDPYV